MTDRTFALAIIWAIVLGAGGVAGWYLYGFWQDHRTCGRIIDSVRLYGHDAQEAYADCIRKIQNLR